MKALLRTMIIASACMLPLTTSSQNVSVGLGVSLLPNAFSVSTSSDVVYYPLGFTTFMIPVAVGDVLRVEPEFGYYSASFENVTSVSSERKVGVARAGIGVLYLFRSPAGYENVRLYLGPRIALIPYWDRERYGSMPEEKTTRTDVLVGIVTGAEYLFSRRFTLGGEVQFNSYSIGKESIEPPPVSPSETNRDYLNLNTAITLRWFFF